MPLPDPLLQGPKALLYMAGNGLADIAGTRGRPVLVAGNGRSGTSWIGGVIGRAPGVLYFREPCHPGRNGLPRDAANAVWSRHVPPDAGDPFFESTLGHAFRGHFWPRSGHGLRAFVRRIGSRPRVVVKEVAAFASLEWISAKWNPEILIVLRHPAAYAASVRNLRQDEDERARLRLLLADRHLMAELSPALRDRLEAIAAQGTPLEIIAASWAIRTGTVLRARTRHPDWTVVHYEDLARDPVAGFRALYDRLGLDWTDAVEAHVRAETTTHSEGAFTTSRISTTRIEGWRRELSAGEIETVRDVVAPFGLPVFAGDADW